MFSNKVFSASGMSRAGRVAISAAIAAAGLCAMSAHADESVTLSIKGTIAPAACTPTLSGGGVADHGIIASASLNESGYTQLPTKMVTLTVSCDAPARVAWNLMDNRSGTAITSIGNNLFSPNPNGGGINSQQTGLGLGFARTGEKIGAARVVALPASVTIDGTAGAMISSYDGGTTWNREEQSMSPWVLSHSGLGFHSISSLEDVAPAAVTVATVNYEIHTSLNQKSKLDLSNAVDLDGSATFTLRYL